MTAPTPNAELAYRVTFDRIGRNHNVAPLDVSKVDGPNHLAKLIFDYARPHLGSREVEVVLEEDVRSGWIFVGGFRTAGTFTIEPVAGEVAEIFGPRPEPQSYGTGCRCDWLGVGTPEHAPSALCRSLRPDADRDEMQPPPCADHTASELACPVCTAQRRAFYAALSREYEVAEIVDHGPVKPPYGTPEREAYDREHGAGS